jgi:hypothetical protein
MPREISQMSNKRIREPWKTAVDILSGLSFFFLVIFCPIWIHFEPHTRDAQGHWVGIVRATFVVTPLCAFGLIWLFVRAVRLIPPQYSLSKPLNFVRWLLAWFAANCLVYLILTNLVWS